MSRIARRRREPWQPKSNSQWNELTYLERRAWIAGLTDAQILVQAEVRATASRRAVSDILTAWVVNGYLDFERKLRLLAALTPTLHEVRPLADGSVWIDGELVTLPTRYNTPALRDLIDERERERAAREG